MITVRCLGHIGTSVGSKEVSLQAESMDAAEVVDRVRSLAKGPAAGFTKFNTLVMVEDGDAFVPAAVKRTVSDGETVVLIPFSHGG